MGSKTGLERSLGEENGNPLQYAAWEIPRTEEHAGLQSMGSQRVGHDSGTKTIKNNNKFYTLLLCFKNTNKY